MLFSITKSFQTTYIFSIEIYTVYADCKDSYCFHILFHYDYVTIITEILNLFNYFKLTVEGTFCKPVRVRLHLYYGCGNKYRTGICAIYLWVA